MGEYFYYHFIKNESDILNISIDKESKIGIATPKNEGVYMTFRMGNYVSCYVKSFDFSTSAFVDDIYVAIDLENNRTATYGFYFNGDIDLRERIFYCTKRGKFVNKNNKKVYSKYITREYIFNAEFFDDEIRPVVITVCKEVKIIGRKHKMLYGFDK